MASKINMITNPEVMERMSKAKALLNCKCGKTERTMILAAGKRVGSGAYLDICKHEREEHDRLYIVEEQMSETESCIYKAIEHLNERFNMLEKCIKTLVGE